jgi:hypothetical protein
MRTSLSWLTRKQPWQRGQQSLLIRAPAHCCDKSKSEADSLMAPAVPSSALRPKSGPSKPMTIADARCTRRPQ